MSKLEKTHGFFIIALGVLMVISGVVGDLYAITWQSPAGDLSKQLDDNVDDVVRSLNQAGNSARGAAESIRSGARSLEAGAEMAGQVGELFGNVGTSININILGFKPLAKTGKLVSAQKSRMTDFQTRIMETSTNLHRNAVDMDSLADNMQDAGLGFRKTGNTIIDYMKAIETLVISSLVFISTAFILTGIVIIITGIETWKKK